MIIFPFHSTLNLKVVSSQVDDDDAVGNCDGASVETAGAGVEGIGAGVGGIVKRSDCVQRSLRNVSRFGRMVVRSFSVVTPNHCAIPFHKDSQGFEGIRIPGSNANGPSFVTERIKLIDSMCLQFECVASYTNHTAKKTTYDLKGMILKQSKLFLKNDLFEVFLSEDID